ncbi:MAG: guanylate kinase [Lachnospiraceae bacterium]|nr:guanylate kinase [Lachnospiraceae bacterium]
MKHKGILIVVSGFAGTGKGTLMKMLLDKYENYALSVSMTTRAPRPGEIDGVSYFFVNKETFEERIAQNGLIEHACYCDNYYGTPRDYVEKQLEAGKDVILEIEIQGAMKVKEQFPQALLLFVMPPSVQELEQRLVGRGTETPEVIHKRMCRAAAESEGIEQYDYIVINDKLEDCVVEMHSIIQAAHYTPLRNEEFIKHIRRDLEGLAKGEK